MQHETSLFISQIVHFLDGKPFTLSFELSTEISKKVFPTFSLTQTDYFIGHYEVLVFESENISDNLVAIRLGCAFYNHYNYDARTWYIFFREVLRS